MAPDAKSEAGAPSYAANIIPGAATDLHKIRKAFPVLTTLPVRV